MFSMAKKKPGRPRAEQSTRMVQIRLHQQLKEQVDKVAKRDLKTMTAVIVEAIRKYLHEEGYWPPGSNSKE